MGATLFGLWMIGLLFLGLCFLTGGAAAFLLLRRRRIKRGLPHRGHTVLTVLCLALAAVDLIPSLGFFGFLRLANAGRSRDFVDTGVYVEGGYQQTEFTVNGVTYRRLDQEMQFCREEGRVYDPVYSWDSTDHSLTLLTLLCGPYYDRGNYYAVPNEPGFDLLCDGGWRLFCPAEELEAATAWYSDMSHFDWYICPHEEEPFTPMDPQPEPEAMAALAGLNGRAKAEGHAYQESGAFADLPAGPLEDSRLGAVMVLLTGENRHLEDTLTLRPVSRDGAVRREGLSLCRYEGRLWFSPTASFREDTAHYYLVPLPAEWEAMLALWA